MSRISPSRSFDSAPSAVPRDKSVRRFAQDDDFVAGLKKNTPNRLNACGTQSWVEIRETMSPVEPALSLSNGDDWKLPGHIEELHDLKTHDPLFEFRTMSR